MAKKISLNERVQGILSSGGTSADLVKRLHLKPTTANIYAWRYRKAGSVNKQVEGKGKWRGRVKKKKSPKARKATSTSQNIREAKDSTNPKSSA